MDFAALPPEVNSGRMYTGVGAGPLLAASTAWDGLASELHSAAVSYQSAVSWLTAGSWSGPSSMLMAAAAAPYVVWLSATAARCEQTSAQARAAATAYETAFAATVPPPAIAANRAQLMSLVATNFLGQNTPAIAATEALYTVMWAQDAAAMYGYAASAAMATQLAPFTPAKQAANPGGQAGPAAAAATSATGAGGLLSQSMATVPAALHQLTAPLQAAAAQVAPVQTMLPGLLPDSAVAYLGLITPYTSAIGTVNLATRLASQPATQAIRDTVDRIAAATGADVPEPAGPAAPGSGMTVTGSGAGSNAPAVTASAGRATPVGPMSVPPAWTATAPPPTIKTVTQVLPDTDLSAASPTFDEAGVSGNLLSQMALAGMAGRAMTRTVRKGNATYTITVTKNPPEQTG